MRAHGQFLIHAMLCTGCTSWQSRLQSPVVPELPVTGTLILDHQASYKHAEGLSRWLDGDLDGARRCFQEALLFDPESPHLLRALARIAMEQGRLQEADRLLARALAAAPDDTETAALQEQLRQARRD